MNLFDKYTRDGQSYEIKKAVIDTESGILDIDISLDFVLPFNALHEVTDEITQDTPGIEGVEYHFYYHDMVQEKTAILMTYLPYMLAEKSASNVLLNSLRRDDIEITEDALNMKVLGKGTADLLNENVASEFSAKIKENFGFDIDVVFISDEEQIRASEKKAAEKETSYIPSAPEHVAKHSQPFDGKVFKGRPFNGEAMSIADLSDTSGRVIIEGEIFDVETKTTRNNSKLVLFATSDGTGSIMGKAFMDEKQWERIEDSFTPGINVKVRGKVEWDDYQHQLSIMAQDIQKKKKEQRQDTAEEKRVELHAHTMMSALDGLADPKELVSLAADWGHSAVAVTDHGVVQAFPDVYAAAKENDIKILYGMEGYTYDDEYGSVGYKDTSTDHIILIAKDKEGLLALYKLVSLSHLEYFYKKPRLPRSLIEQNREHLLIGSACVAGEMFKKMLSGASDEELETAAAFYDYLEVQPISNNAFLMRAGTIQDEEGLRDLNRRLIRIADKIGKPVVATSDAHYLEAADDMYRKVLQAGQNYDEIDQEGGLFFRTTDEMIEEFSYLGNQKAHEIVIENTNTIAEMIDDISPIATGKFPPEIKDSDKILRETCENNARNRYGDPLPDRIKSRLDRELDSIIGNGYAVMYISAKMLVEKSLSDGYVVGSRGSVGSSFAATMSGITEVNPLPPHYICPDCKHFEWGDAEVYECGVDMPLKVCPECGTLLEQDGHSIPFETFLGFEGNKEPDIDLNFAGEYQQTAHKYVEEIFGKGNVFKAGTIGTIKFKTARGFALKYFEKLGKQAPRLEIDRIAQKCVGVKRTTGQHPGGIIILPKGHEIYEFCPVQRPANDTGSDVTTTHFDYHSIDENLLKLDILGHDAPSMIRHLYDLTGIDPETVSLKDEKVNSLFQNTDALDIKIDNYRFTHGSYGIPEFGTRFVRQMLDDTSPSKFADLVRIAGLSHGTDVWLNNAQKFIRDGQATINDCISTRDDIMRYLIIRGLPDADAFSIMENVRKGKGLSKEQENEMIAAGVPEWYRESCKLIKYMFPRAHAVAYVMMSYRIAYFKVYHPAAFYAAYLSTKLQDFNWDVISQGIKVVEERIKEIEMSGDDETSDKEKAELIVYEVVYEMLARGICFAPPSLGTHSSQQFTLENGMVKVPLSALDGLGDAAGRMIEEQARVRPYATVEDLITRGKANKTAIESLKKHGVLDGLPESDQFSFF